MDLEKLEFFKDKTTNKPSLGSRDVPHKIWAVQFSRFDVYWIQTDRQTDKQSIYIDGARKSVRTIEIGGNKVFPVI